MQIELNRESALRALKIARSFTDKDPEPWRFLLLEASDDEIVVSGNGQHGRCTVCNLDGKVKKPGSARVRADFFTELAAKCSDDTIQVSEKAGTVTVNSGKSRYRLSSLAQDAFKDALLRAQAGDTGLLLPPDTLLPMLQFCAFAMANGDVRHWLNGACIHVGEREVSVSSADGISAAYATCPLEEVVPEDRRGDLIIPRGSVLNLLAAIGDAETVELGLELPRFWMKTDKLLLEAQTLQGGFPNIPALLPKGVEVMVKRGDMISALERSILLAKDDQSPSVMLEVDDGKLHMSLRSQSDQDEWIAATHKDGQRGEKIVGPERLLEACRAFTTDEIKLTFPPEGDKPLRLDAPEKLFSCVVMPRRAS